MPCGFLIIIRLSLSNKLQINREDFFHCIFIVKFKNDLAMRTSLASFFFVGTRADVL